MIKLSKKIYFSIFFLFILFLIAEFSLRTFLTFKHYENPNVSYWGKTWYSYEEGQIVINKFDQNLVSVLKLSNYQNLNLPRWSPNANITINSSGYRENENDIDEFINKKKILVTGDSFAYGSQVSNNQTWPSYLENLIKIKVYNAGHPGYGTGMSIRKALIRSKTEKFDYFIWSIIFNDFNRDKDQKFIIKKNGLLRFNKFKKNDLWSEDKTSKSIYSSLKEYFFSIYLTDRIIFNRIKKFFNKKDNISMYVPLIEGSTNYTVDEQIQFLMKKFKEIEIENKYILLQHPDLSENISQELIDARKKIYDDKYKSDLFKYANLNGIKILDTEKIFENMNPKIKRLMWLDHHTAKGNEEIAKFIFENINFN